ncbi:MAG: hypothetical protein E7523_02220 [Ruminococcaceae bacterium]|nr:hypothetical protein [Oscillospiraceae bacterium]
MKNKISSLQLFCILFVSRLLGTFTYMSQLQTTLHAGSRIVATGVCLIFSILSAIPVLLFLQKQNNASFLNSVSILSDKTSRLIGIFYAVVFLFAAIITITRFGLFAGTVLIQNTGLYISVFFLLLVSIYCVYQGLQPFARTAVIFAVILLFSLISVIAGTIGECDLSNIPSVQKNEIPDIVRQAFFSACRNIEIPALLFISEEIKGKAHSTVLKFITVFSIISALLFTVAGGVLGEFGEQQIFPLFTLTSVAKFGLFERMEDLLTGIWIVCAMLKTAFLLYVASQCLQKSLHKEKTTRYAAIGGGLIFAGYLIFSADIPTTIRLLRTWFLPAGYIIFAVLLPAVLYVLIGRKEKKLKKENST